MSYRVFITGSGLAEEAQQYLRQRNIAFEAGDPKDTPSDLARRLSRFDPHGLIVRQGDITAEVQAAAPSLKAICKHGVGTDNIDVAAATRRGIPVLYTPRANFESAAQHTLALMLALLRQIPLQDRRIRGGVFDKKGYGGVELLGKTVGIVGFGRIGRRLAELLGPFQASVLVYHPSTTPEPLPGYVTKLPRAEDLLSRADVITLHCPLTPATRGMIGERALASMRQGAFLVNTARGGIVDEAALVRALRDGRVRGAALDVFEVEPPAADNPLLGLDNVLLTAHVAGVSDNSSRNMGLQAAKGVLAVLEGLPPDRESLVNRELLG